MRKRLFLTVFIIILVFALSSCSNNESLPMEENEDASVNKLPEFEALDLYGNTVTNEMFSEYPVTMVNIWGTFCGPCIREMPDLAALHNEMKEMNTNLVGILVDVSENENKDLAIDITEGNGASFVNIIPDDQLIGYLSQNIPAVPTTIFIDSEGNIIGEPVVGARGKDDYKDILLKRLEMVEDSE